MLRLIHSERNDRMNYKKAFNEISQYYFTVSLVIFNIVIFLICTFTGNMLYNEGAFYVFGVMTDKEYYRLLSSVFLHYNVEHLFNNMVLLFFLGRIIEKMLYIIM